MPLDAAVRPEEGAMAGRARRWGRTHSVVLAANGIQKGKPTRQWVVHEKARLEDTVSWSKMRENINFSAKKGRG